MNPRRFYLLIVVFLASIWFLSACNLSRPGQTGADKTTPTADLVAVRNNNIFAEGQLVPNEFTSLTFPTGGRVSKLFVSEGSQVEAGQVIAHLEGEEQIQASVEAARFELLSAQQAIDVLNDTYAGALADAQQKLAQARIDLEDAQDDRASMVYRRASDATIRGLEADLIMAQEELDKSQDYYDHHQYGDDLVRAQALSMLSVAIKARDRAQYNLNYAMDLPDKNEIDKADAKLKVAEANLETARLNLERLSDGPDSRSLALAEARRQNAETALDAAQANLDNLDLKAPFSGKIVDLDIAQGEEVTPGKPIATLVDFSRWIVETSDLTELNVVRLKPGQKANLVADALPDVEFTGTVEEISDRFIEKQGDITYTTRIALDQNDPRLRWGMTFAVELEPSPGDGEASQGQPAKTPVPTSTAETLITATPSDAASQAETAVEDYFAALENKDPQSAVDLLSNFSLIAEQTTREGAVDAISTQLAQGDRWSELTIEESQALDPQTTLVHVLYQHAITDPKTGETTLAPQDEWWPVRLENGQWLVNWNHVIDFRGLDIPGQTTGGLTVTPTQINRYPDRYRLGLFVQNKTNDPIVLGQPNETLARFTFGDQTVDAEQTKLVFGRMKSYPNVGIEVKGENPEFPDKVDIRIWKNYQVPPWFSFNLSSETQ